MKKAWNLLSSRSVPPAAPVSPDVSSPAARAYAAFAGALRTDAFRTIAFATPTPNDIDHYYLEMRADDAALAQWSVYPVRRRANPAANLMAGTSSAAITLTAPIATGINFIAAMDYAANFESAEYARGAIPVHAPGDLGNAHYIAAGRGEGLLFNIHNQPRPTLNGRAVIPDTYPEDAWNGVVIRSDLPGLERDLTAHTLAHLVHSVVGRSTGDSSPPRAFSEHLQVLGDQQKLSQILLECIEAQKAVAENFTLWEESRGYELRGLYEHMTSCFGRVKTLQQENPAAFSFLEDLIPLFTAQEIYYGVVCVQGARLRGTSIVGLCGIKAGNRIDLLIKDAALNCPQEEKEKYSALLLLQFRQEYLPLMPGHGAVLAKLQNLHQQVECAVNQNRGAAFSDMVNTFGAAAQPLVPAPSPPDTPAQGVPKKDHLVL